MVEVITREQAQAVMQRLSVQEVKHYQGNSPEIATGTREEKENLLKQAVGVRLKDITEQEKTNLEIDNTDGYVTQEQLNKAINKRLTDANNIDTAALKQASGEDVNASNYTQVLTTEQKEYIWKQAVKNITREAPKEKPETSTAQPDTNTDSNTTTPKPTVKSTNLGAVDTSNSNASLKVQFNTEIKPVNDDKSIAVKLGDTTHTLNQSHYSITDNNKTLEINKDGLTALGITENNNTAYRLTINADQLANYSNKNQKNKEIKDLSFKTNKAEDSSSTAEYSVDGSTSKTIKIDKPTKIIFNKDINLVTNTNLSQSIYFLELDDQGKPKEDIEENRTRLPRNHSVTVKDNTMTIAGLKARVLRPGRRYQLVIPPNILIEAEDKKNTKITFNFDPVEN